MMLTKGIVFGHHVSSVGIRVDPTKIEVIVELVTPNSQKDVISFMGHASYYKRFIENFTKVVSPLFKVLAKDVVFYWNEDCQHDFESLNKKLCSTPILRGPNLALPFHISSDASNTTIRVLGQKEGSLNYAICFTSKNMTPVELNYTITKRNFLLLSMSSINLGIILQDMRYMFTLIILQLNIL